MAARAHQTRPLRWRAFLAIVGAYAVFGVGALIEAVLTWSREPLYASALTLDALAIGVLAILIVRRGSRRRIGPLIAGAAD